MNALMNRDLARASLPLVCGVLGALAGAYVIASPSASAFLSLMVFGGVAVGIALALPPHVFIPGALLVAGVSTAFGSAWVSIGPAALYVSDLMLLVIVLRGALPRARKPGPHALAGRAQLLFAAWLLILAIAGIRAMLGGVPTQSIIRGDLALFYWPLLYFGFTRVLAEIDLDVELLWRNLALVALGFAFYMFIARALNHPFHDPGLALVPTGPGQSVPRNFGFASAFIIYPVLAIVGVAGMANSREHRFRWLALTSIGIVATLTTLVRGEIFSLAAGIFVVLLLSPRSASKSGRAQTAAKLALATAATVSAVFAVAPTLGHAVIQRSLPFTHQAQGAVENADYRFAAMGTGIRIAREHPAGLGILDVQELVERNIDTGYFAHSGFATLLIEGGWIALVGAILILLTLIGRSFRVVPASGWHHPAFVGAITVLSVYSLSAAGLVGDTWVIPLGVLAVALRFGLQPR
jgi:hypothetical protein